MGVEAVVRGLQGTGYGHSSWQMHGRLTPSAKPQPFSMFHVILSSPKTKANPAWSKEVCARGGNANVTFRLTRESNEGSCSGWSSADDQREV